MTAQPPGDPPDPPDPLDPIEATSGAPVPPAAPVSTEASARARRRTWRRRRRILGTVAFLAVVVVLGFVIVSAVGGGDDDTEDAAESTTTTTPPTTTLPPAGPYEVIDGINIRTGPGATFPIIGQIELGNKVMVLCVTEGDSVTGGGGTTTKWLRIQTIVGPAYVTAAYVSVGPDLINPAVIGTCTT